MDWYKQTNCSRLNRVLFIKVILIKKVLDKHLAFKYGQMVANTKESGKMGRHVGKVNSGMLTAIGMKANGNLIRQMGMDYICMPTVQSI